MNSYDNTSSSSSQTSSGEPPGLDAKLERLAQFLPEVGKHPERWESEYKRAQEELDKTSVHSFASLSESRKVVQKLLTQLPEVQRCAMLEVAIKQEISLQESIRLESYSTSEFYSRMKKMLTYFVCVMAGICVLMFCAIQILGAFGKHVDETAAEMFNKVINVLVVSAFGTIIAFFFKERKF